MKKYNIYGIGGALIDTEVRVSDKFLTDTNIDKGVMTLVDESRLGQLVEAFSNHEFRLKKTCGGSVCNSIIAASCFGAKTFFSGKIADDEDGKLYACALNKAGVDFQSGEKECGITGKCLVMITPDAERTMNTFLGACETLSIKEIDFTALKNSDWLYVEGYLVTNEGTAIVLKNAVEFARKNDVKIAISLSDPFVVDAFGDALREILSGGVDLIFCNMSEALTFTRTNDVQSAIQKFQCLTKSVVITDGANGAVTFDGKSLVRSEGFSAKAVDTTGAGDMFAGSFLYGIISGYDYGWSARLANYCSSRVVTQFGPRLKLEDFVMVKRKFGC